MDLQFAERQAVWAQSGEHSWWPAKIVSVQKQFEKTHYNVAFFPECALQPSPQVLPAALLRPLSQDSTSPDITQSLPLNALRAARRHAARTKRQRQRPPRGTPEGVSGDCLAEQKTEEMRVQNSTPVEEEQRVEAQPVPLGALCEMGARVLGEITTENVLGMIAANRRREKPSGYSYETRKEETQLQAELKRNLLLRFNLHAFDLPTAHSLPQQPLPSRSIIQITQENLGSKDYRRMCRVKSRGALLQGQTEMLRRRCVRKVTALLRRHHSLQQSNPKREASRIVKRIVQLADDSRIKLQSLFVTLVKALAASSPKMPCEERLSEFSSYLEQLQTDKHEDEGSKITQIEVGN